MSSPLLLNRAISSSSGRWHAHCSATVRRRTGEPGEHLVAEEAAHLPGAVLEHVGADGDLAVAGQGDFAVPPEVLRAAMTKGAPAAAPVDLFTMKLTPAQDGASLSLAWGDESWLLEILPAK